MECNKNYICGKYSYAWHQVHTREATAKNSHLICQIILGLIKLQCEMPL